MHSKASIRFLRPICCKPGSSKWRVRSLCLPQRMLSACLLVRAIFCLHSAPHVRMPVASPARPDKELQRRRGVINPITVSMCSLKQPALFLACAV